MTARTERGEREGGGGLLDNNLICSSHEQAARDSIVDIGDFGIYRRFFLTYRRHVTTTLTCALAHHFGEYALSREGAHYRAHVSDEYVISSLGG